MYMHACSIHNDSDLILHFFYIHHIWPERFSEYPMPIISSRARMACALAHLHHQILHSRQGGEDWLMLNRCFWWVKREGVCTVCTVCTPKEFTVGTWKSPKLNSGPNHRFTFKLYDFGFQPLGFGFQPLGFMGPKFLGDFEVMVELQDFLLTRGQVQACQPDFVQLVHRLFLRKAIVFFLGGEKAPASMSANQFNLTNKFWDARPILKVVTFQRQIFQKTGAMLLFWGSVTGEESSILSTEAANMIILLMEILHHLGYPKHVKVYNS